MEYNDFQQDDLERFLQDTANDHRMYPSDHIWKNIRTSLHGKQTWPALTVISLFIICGLTISTLLFSPSKEVYLLTSHHNEIKNHPTTVAKNNSISHKATAAYIGQLEPNNFTLQTMALVSSNRKAANDFPSASEIPADNIEAISSSDRHKRLTLAENIQNEIGIDIETSRKVLAQLEFISTKTVSSEINKTNQEDKEKINLLKTIKEDITASIDNSYLKKINSPKQQFLILKKLSKLEFQFYTTPSKSYRTLSDAEVKNIIQPNITANTSLQTVPMAALNYSANVNDVVRHRAATGLEIGAAALYKISDRLKFKTGAQLNVRQYQIETFKTFSRDLNSISLINNNGIQTINFLSSYNNQSGYQSAKLNNKTYQLAIPLGIEWEMLKGDPLSLSMETSVQPTVSLNNNTYLLSTDYKNYTDGGNFFRKWNINTSAGINISYKAGQNLWQIGPQIRYQHLPTYTNQYPIKEHLMDYGIRLAVTRQWK